MPYRFLVKSENIAIFILILYGIYKSMTLNIVGFYIPFFNIFILISSFLLILSAIYNSSISNQLKIILSFSFLDLDYLLYLLPILLLPKIILLNSQYKTKVNSVLLIFLGLLFYIIIVSFYNYFLDLFLASIMLGLLIFCSGLFCFLYFFQFHYYENDLKVILIFFEKLIYVQLLIILIQMLLDGSFRPGDWGIGSLGETDKIGVFFTLLFLTYSLPFFISKKHSFISIFKENNIIKIGLLGIAVVLVDSKIITLGICFGTLIFIWIKSINKIFFYDSFFSQQKIWLISLSTILVLSLIPRLIEAYSLKFNKQKIDFNEIVSTYTTNPEFAKKAIFFKRTFIEMKDEYPLTWVFGTGFGKYGSRASNAFASDVLYKDKNSSLPNILPVYSSKWVKQYMRDLYTEEVYKTIWWKSANLAIPFSGIITIKGEFGIIGFILFLLIIFLLSFKLASRIHYFRDEYIQTWILVISIFALSLPILMIFDNFHETPQIMLPLLVLSGVMLRTNSI